jgi:hypothetical protein
MVCFAQTMHLSCTNTNTVSKQSKTRFHMTHVPEEFHRVCPKCLPSLWYVRHKPCTYLALRLALSSKEPKQGSTWALSPRSTIGSVQNDFWPYGTFGANRAPSCTDANTISKQTEIRFDWPKSPKSSIGASKMISEPRVCSAQTLHLSCVKVSNISKRTGMSFHLSLVT